MATFIKVVWILEAITRPWHNWSFYLRLARLLLMFFLIIPLFNCEGGCLLISRWRWTYISALWHIKSVAESSSIILSRTVTLLITVLIEIPRSFLLSLTSAKFWPIRCAADFLPNSKTQSALPEVGATRPGERERRFSRCSPVYENGEWSLTNYGIRRYFSSRSVAQARMSVRWSLVWE